MAIIGANAAVLGKSVMKFFQQAATTGGEALNKDGAIWKGGAWDAVGKSLAGTGGSFKEGASRIAEALTNPNVLPGQAKFLNESGMDLIGSGLKGVTKAGQAMFLPEWAGGSAGWGTRMGQYAAGAYGARVMTGGGLNPLRRRNSDRMDIIGIPFI